MRQNLLVLAQTYANARGWALTTVSKKIHGNQDFLAEFLAGRISTTIRTYYRMVDKLREDWPRGTPWPTTVTIPRPLKKGEAAR